VFAPSEKVDTPSSPGIPLLRTILEKPEAARQALLGDFGDRLFDFASSIDLKHPDVLQNTILDGTLGGEFSTKIQQLFALYEFASERDLTTVIPCIVKVALTRIEKELKAIGSPYDNQQLVRLLPTREERDVVRKTKEVRDIRLGYYLKKGESVWAGLPTTFDMFIRHSTLYRQEVDKAKKKADKFASLGCVSMAKVVEDSIASFSEKIGDSHYGFHRVTLANAALIAAKMYKFPINFKTPETLKVPKDFFGYDLHPCKGDVIVSKRGSRTPHMIGTLAPSLMDYAPRVYPVHRLVKTMSNQMLKVLDRLESFPEADDKSLFDHYLVVVPSVRCPKDMDNKLSFYERNAKTRSVFKNEKEANEALDIHLITIGTVHPLLLGEKDGKCYFISYWR